MIVPIVAIPPSIEMGLAPYRDLFPRIETYQHIKEYCTGLVVLEKPSINRLAACLVEGPAQSSINKALTQSPWSEEMVNQRRLEGIQPYHRGQGLRVGIIVSHVQSSSSGREEDLWSLSVLGLGQRLFHLCDPIGDGCHRHGGSR
jgi:hypothetical protein